MGVILQVDCEVFQMTIGEKIAKRRKELDLTQEQLAKKLGYKSKSTINKIELGINDMTQSRVVSFAEALNVSVAYLMGWDDEQPADIPDGLSEEETAMLDLFSRLSPGARENTLQALRILGSLQEADQRAVSDLVLAVLQTKGLL